MPRRVARELRHVLARCAGVDGPVPWVDGPVADLACDLGLAGVVDAAIRHGRVRSALTAPRRERLRRSADLEAALVLAAEDEARRVAARLHGEGIEVVALKGLVANALDHRPRGWCRTPGDVDLLVAPEDVDRATALFLDDPAYERHGSLDPSFYADHHHAQPFARRGRHAVPIEIHRRVSGATTGDLRLDTAGCVRRAIPFPELAPHLLRLDDVDQVLVSVVHIDRDDAYHGRARQLFDLALAWSHCTGREDELAARARAWNLGPTIERTRRLLDAFLDRPQTHASAAADWLWTPLALDLSMGTGDEGTQNALPVWYRQGIFRAVMHAKGLRAIASAVFDPVWRRTIEPRGNHS